jgi:peptidoglycan hydrolase-like protein with peptidoglycan-binding domain
MLSPVDIGSLLVALALFIIVAAVVAQPLLERTAKATPKASPTEALVAEREQVLIALRDLDFDHATGKLAEEDYQTQRVGLVSRGADVLRQLDRLGVDGTPAGSLDDQIEAAVAARRQAHGAEAAPAGSLDAQIEAAVAARRRPAKDAAPAAAALACPACGKPYQPGDKFCGRCGARLPVTAES